MSGRYHVRMYGRPDRETDPIFLWIFTAVAALITIATTVFLVADLRGGNATAMVVSVRSQEVYTVAFVTRDGTRCQESQKWSPRPKRVNVYDTFQVHYSSLSPCYNFGRSDDRSFYWAYPILPILLAACVVGLLARRERRVRDDDWFRVRHF
jgi:hypothetical protein